MSHEVFLTFAAFTVGVTVLWMRVSAMAEEYSFKIKELNERISINREINSDQGDHFHNQIHLIKEALKVLNSRLK